MTPASAAPPREHVAIVHAWVAQAILDGTKTIESRFSRDKRPPFGRIAKGDTIYFRVAGGGYAVRCTVQKVECREAATPGLIEDIESKHRDRIGGDDAYWLAARRARCVTLVHLHRCAAIEDGPTLDRQRGDRRAWFVIG